MTEERKDGNAKSIRRARRERHMKALFLLMRAAVNHLRRRIKADDTPGISWRNPFAQLEYTVGTPSDIGECPEKLTEAEAAALWHRLFKTLPRTALHIWTRDVLIHKIEPYTENGRLVNCQVILPPLLKTIAEGWSESEREARLKESAAGHTFPGDSNLPGLGGTGEADTPAGRQAYAFELVFTIQPLTITVKGDRAFFPVIAGLKFTEGDPAAWSSDEDRDAIFEKILKGIDDLDARVGPYLDKREAAGKPAEPDHVRAVRPEDFAVAASAAHAIHTLAGRAGRLNTGPLLFPEERRQFYELRTPLFSTVSLALFESTSEDCPEEWQEVTPKDLEDKVFCLTERDAPSRGDHWPDILEQVVKLHNEKNIFVQYEDEKRGRFWHRKLILTSSYAIPEFGLIYLDKKGRRALPSDPAYRNEVSDLVLKGRRAYKPDGKGIKTLPEDRFKLVAIRFRWNKTIADGLKNAPALDAKGNVKRGGKKILRAGYNVRVKSCIFPALFALRSERAYLAAELLLLLAHDIKKKDCTAAGRNMIEREAGRLYDLLNLQADPNHPERREEAVAAAIYRLKQKDIAALLPGSDERPRPPSEAERASGRRKGLYYRLVRSPAYAPKAALVTKEEAAELKAEEVEAAAPVLPPALPGPKVEQAVLPGMELPAAAPIPAGADIRAAREAAGVNLRDFARDMKGPGIAIWSRYETGNPVRVENIKPDTWQRVRDFITKHGPKAGL